MEKHSAYFNLLDQLKKPECPICGQLLLSLKQFLDAYLYEGVTDQDNWNRLTASEGYCPRHNRLLEGFGDGLAVSLFYRHLLRKNIQVFENPASAKSSWLTKLVYPKPRVPGATHCPACEYEREIEEAQLRLFCQAIEEEEFWSTWQTHPGLCLPHFKCALEHWSGPLPGRALEFSKQQCAKLEGLAAELDEFVRKSEHRATEKMGSEGDAWKRVLRRFNGKNW